MRTRILLVFSAVLLGISLFVVAGDIRAATEPSDVIGNNSCANIICTRMKFLDKNSPYLVKISSGGEDPNAQSGGTGFVHKNEDGRFVIITNNHVLGPLANPKVAVLFEGEDRWQDVEIVGRDPALDVALLAMPESRPRQVMPAPVNFSVSLEIGDEIYGIGYPLNKREISFGWVNGLESPGSQWSFSSQVPIHPGNSGGPMVRFGKNGQPEIVGVNTEIFSLGVKSFSIHTRYVGKILPRLLREKIVSHAAAGMKFDDSKKIPPFFFRNVLQTAYPPSESGVMVVDAMPGSPAEQAGFKGGDILAKAVVKGHEIPFKNARELLELIFFDLRPGDPLTLFVKRGDQVLEKTVVLGEHALSSEK